MKRSLCLFVVGLALSSAGLAASCGGNGTGSGGGGGNGGGVAGGFPSSTSSSTGGLGGGSNAGGSTFASVGGGGQGGGGGGVGGGGGSGGAPNACTDGTKDGAETDVDCGGGTCPTCDIGKTCLVPADCTSTQCLGGLCSAGPTCTDNVKDGTETDVDCGGTSCPKCADGKTCNLPADCASGVCASGSCATANCSDGVKNQDETDIDCGGATCPTCNLGQSCTMESDCASGHCVGNKCVECEMDTDCTGETDDCQHPACGNTNTCAQAFSSMGTPLTTQVPGDCHLLVCDGMGGQINQEDDTDPPTNSGECTHGSCTMGTPGQAPTAVGTTCTTGGSICNGAGVCTDLRVMVVRVGDGTTMLSSTSAPVFVEEWPFSGAEVRTIALPAAASGGNQPFSLAGTGTSEGALSLSADGHFVTVGGYAAIPGTATIAGTSATTTNRVVARVDAMGNVDTSTTLGTTAFSGNPIRGATSADGSSIWVSGNGSGTSGGAWHVTLGTPASALQIDNAPANMRCTGIFGAQLFGSASSGTFTNVFTIGSGEPTTAGQASTTLPGMLTSGASPFGFVLLDRTAVPGLDTLYVSEDNALTNATSPGGVQRWTFNGTTWTRTAVFNGGLTSGVRGVTAKVVGNSVVIIATTAESTSRLVAFIDDGVVTSGTAIVIATTTSPMTTEFYRGVAISPN